MVESVDVIPGGRRKEGRLRSPSLVDQGLAQSIHPIPMPQAADGGMGRDESAPLASESYRFLASKPHRDSISHLEPNQYHL